MRMLRLLTAIVCVCCFTFFGSLTFCDEATQAGADALVDEAVRKGVDFLVRSQHVDGSWGESTVGRSYEVMADVPGSHRAFRVATSALCVMALQNSGIRDEAVENAVRQGLKYLIKEGRVKRPNSVETYNVWAFGYGLRCLSEALFAGTCPDMADSMRERAEDLVAALRLYQVPDGGWGYFDFVAGTYRPSDSSMSFITGTVVIGLYAARRAGIDVPEQMLQKALLTLHRCRKEDGSYIYGWYLRYYTGHPVNKLKGSVCRTSCCHLAQYLFNNRVSYEDLVRGVEALVEHNRFVDTSRKRPIPHEGWYANSGYFYLYGHFYASMVLQQLNAQDQKRLWPKLENLILRLQEPDGAWWDYPLYGYHKYYGTAYAVLTLCWDRDGRGLYVRDSASLN